MAGTPEGTGEQGIPSGATATQEGTPEVGPEVDPEVDPVSPDADPDGSSPRAPRRRPGRRLGPAERSALVERLGQRYTEGASIRQIAGEEQLSYGFVHRLLTESGTELRGRGGSTRRRAAS